MEGPRLSPCVSSVCSHAHVTSSSLRALDTIDTLTTLRCRPSTQPSSQRRFQTRVSTSLLNISTWMSKVLSTSVSKAEHLIFPPKHLPPPPVSVSCNSILPVGQVRRLGSSLTLPFLPHLTFSLSGYPVESIFRIFTDSSHFLPLPLLPPGPKLGLRQQLPEGLSGLPAAASSHPSI